jgi:hypothetical protein
MDDRELIRKSQEILNRERELPAADRWQRLIDQGVIDENGQVPLWDAFLAVVAVQRGTDGNHILHFRCLKPVFGMPGFAQIDLSRDSLLRYLTQENKRVITAYRDEKFNRWKEGAEVRVTPQGHLRTDRNQDEEDSLGELPSFSTVNSQL